jgi:hypothetical protein
VYRLEFPNIECDFYPMTDLAQALTASRLRDGEVVYWHGGGWVTALIQAELFMEDIQAEAALQAAGSSVRDRIVVNPYLFEVRVTASGILPVKEREIIRAAGPTVRPDLGKQGADHVSL